MKKRLEAQLLLHKKRAQCFYDQLKISNEKSKNEEHKETLCFDFEQNFPFPQLPVGEIFYKRQLWFFIFVYILAKMKLL